MDNYGTHLPVDAKEAEPAIVSCTCQDISLMPVLVGAQHEQMPRYFAEYGYLATKHGEPPDLAVAANEPPARPIAACRKVQVAIDVDTPLGQGTLPASGLAVMRQGRLARLN
jgi:hypothetical protein